MGSTRRAFTDEYKAHAVELVINDRRTIVDVARGIEVHAMTLGKWVKKAKDEGQAGDTPLNSGLIGVPVGGGVRRRPGACVVGSCGGCGSRGRGVCAAR